MVTLDKKTMAIIFIIDLVIVIGLTAWVATEGAKQREAFDTSSAQARLGCSACLDRLPPWVRFSFPTNETECPICNMSRSVSSVETPKVRV